MNKTIAISTGPATHLDHLGVLCILLGIPLIVTEESTYRLAKKYYPELQVFHKDPGDLSIDFLAQFDRILQCGQFWAVELKPLIELLYGKKVRIIFCPHGNSDKGHSVQKLPPQDIALIYGDQMQDLFKEKGVSASTLIRSGNYRFPYYRKQRNFFDAKADEEVFSKLDPRRRTLLYAPSWNDGENFSSFFDGAEKTLKELVSKFNVILKLHPLLEEHHPAETIYISAQLESLSNLALLREFPPIYPLLARSSAYIGDYSSIGYDFLAFDRPLFFLNPQPVSLTLHKCGLTLPVDGPIASFIEKRWGENQHTYSPLRRKAYHYAFGEEQIASKLRNEILSKS